jgi:uncharacterized protein YbjT (DUF2867 family)
MTELTLILGGTGKTGSRIATRLTAAGVPVRIGSRSGTPPFDWDDRTTWPAAIEDVANVYVAYQPDLAVPGAAETVQALARLAARSGVRRLVLLSGRGEDEAQRSERLVRAEFPAATLLRCAWFAQNFSESFLAEAVASGIVALPVDGVPEPFIDVEDIADVAVAALTSDRHAGELYELTGPQLITFQQATATIAKASGRPLRYERLALDDFVAALHDEQLPPDVVALIAYLFGEVMDGRNAHVGDGVERALGRPAREFADYARSFARRG